MPVVRADRLLRLATEIFERSGATAEDAQIVAQHLVDANLAGHDSHGVLRIPQYIDLIRGGRLQPAGKPQVVHDAPASAMIDGGGGFGQVVAREAMLLAIQKARAGGIGAVTVRHCSHTGRIGTYTHLAALEGFVGIAFVNSGGAGQAVVPFGGIARRLSTNPISIGAPSDGPFPIVFDVASSVAPEGKVRAIFQAGKNTPPGWLIDAQGKPTTNPADFYAEPSGALLPLGGAVGHKGFGLALVIDILAGVLSGAGWCQPNPPAPSDGMLAIALDIEQFMPLADFRRHVSELAAHVKDCPTAPGVSQIFVPGEVEARERERRLQDGIFVEPAMWEQFEQIAQRLGFTAADY